MFSKFDEVKSKVKLSEIVSGEKITFQSGVRYKRCPICSGINSFSIIPEGSRGNNYEIFKCFKCNNHGSVIDYYCVMNNLDQISKINQSKALKELSNKFNMKMVQKIEKIILPNNNQKKYGTVNQKQYDFTKLAQDLHENLVNKEKFIFTLSDDEDMACNYYRYRGLSDEVIKRFKLGYCIFGMNSAFSDFQELCGSRANDYY